MLWAVLTCLQVLREEMHVMCSPEPGQRDCVLNLAGLGPGTIYVHETGNLNLANTIVVNAEAAGSSSILLSPANTAVPELPTALPNSTACPRWSADADIMHASSFGLWAFNSCRWCGACACLGFAGHIFQGGVDADSCTVYRCMS